MLQGLEPLCSEPGWESCGCSAWRREGSGETLEPFPVPKGAPGELAVGLECQDKGNGFPFQRAGLEEILPWEGGEVLAQGAQRSCGCSMPGSIQGQVGGALEQPGLEQMSLPMAGGGA